MRVTNAAVLLAFLAFFCAGCSICPPGYIDDYAGVGGKWLRGNPTSGRVGSVLSDPGNTVGMAANAAEGTYSDANGNAGDVYYDDGTIYQGDGYESQTYPDDGGYYEPVPPPAEVIEGGSPNYDDYQGSSTSTGDSGVIILGEQW